ncbi:hypothetical protein AB0M46_27015 [Dactylosporangium sp. NPDC051485]|uniref:hypothetical protein n=1 Tax=Dactylosporangium sp. NPDC051485 TaxID=3154846 RepID=UPI0034372898
MSTAPHQHASALPHPEAPVIDPDSVPQAQRHLIPRFGDAQWPTTPMSQNPSAASQNILWEPIPTGFRESMRAAAWAMFRQPLPEALVAEHNNRMVTKPSIALAYHTTVDWRNFAIWADSRGIGTLPDVRAADMADYVRRHVQRGLARDTVKGLLVALTRLHYYSTLHLPPEHHLTAPPWLTEGIDDYLPAGSSGGENNTDAINPDTMGPLLIWALRFVEDFADDILTAFAEQQQLRDATHARAEAATRDNDTFAKIEAFLEDLLQHGQAVPSRSRNGGLELTHPSLFVAGVTGTRVSEATIVLKRQRWADAAAANPGPCRLSTPATATIAGTLWQPGFDFYAIGDLHRHLVTACFVVIAYLTGMRPAEVLALRSGCCPDPDGTSSEAGPMRFLINGKVFKNARDDDGIHLSGGLDRDTPWVAIPPVVRAIRVMERIVGEGDLLFDRDTPYSSRTPSPGRSLTHKTVAHRIERLISWVNDYAQTIGRPAEVIPADPDGAIGISRFRRTLAWHIARRPGGLVALAVQYGHLRTIVSEGYYSRSRDGIHKLIDLETAREIAERLSDLNEAIENNEGISGPAARRLIDAAAREHHRFGGVITTHRQARALLNDPGLTVFENQRSFLLCNYARDKALCHPGRAKNDTPSLDRCQPRCANIARTDQHAAHMLQHADHLQALASATPSPLADRLRTEAEALTARAQQHLDNRITTGTAS